MDDGGRSMAVIETQRLTLREMNDGDWTDLCEILQDPLVMYAYEHAFNDEEAREWLKKQYDRYSRYGYGLWAVLLKDTGEWVGQCGLTMQDIGEDEPVPEVGYLFKQKYWHKGYATEAARACKAYAFEVLGFDRVYSIIRDTNQASQRVALRNGMRPVKTIVKHYYTMDMPHYVYMAEKGE